MSDENVIKWPKTRGPDMACARCSQPIVKGQHYAMVRVPDGGLVPVHGNCMDDNTEAPTVEEEDESI